MGESRIAAGGTDESSIDSRKVARELIVLWEENERGRRIAAKTG
jgi:hypothetical protein